MSNKQNHQQGNSSSRGRNQHTMPSANLPSRQAPNMDNVVQTAKDTASTFQAQAKETLTTFKDEMSEKLGTGVEDAKATLQQASTRAGEMLETTGRTLVEAVKANPIPIAMTGVGITWLMINLLTADSDTDSQASSGSTRSSKASSRISSSAKNKLRTTGQAIERFGHDALERGRKLEGTVERVARDNPVATGAVLFAAGAAIGMALPRSDRENQWLGESRDRMFGKVKDVARQALDKVEAVAHAVTGSDDSTQPMTH